MLVGSASTQEMVQQVTMALGKQYKVSLTTWPRLGPTALLLKIANGRPVITEPQLGVETINRVFN